MNKNRHHSQGTHGRGIRGHRNNHRQSRWFSEMIARRGPKIERGETRYLVLDALNENGRHGYDIMQVIQQKTGGMYRPSPGTVYPILQMLEDLKMISSSVEGNRKVYELTEKGSQELDSQQSLLEDIYEDMDQGQNPEQDEFFEETHEQLTRMFKSISRSFHRGLLDVNKADKVRDIIREAVRNVDEVLKSSAIGG